MRKCEWGELGTDECDKIAVIDFTVGGKWFWVCAEHYDTVANNWRERAEEGLDFAKVILKQNRW